MRLYLLFLVAFLFYTGLSFPIHKLKKRIKGQVLTPEDPQYNETIRIDNSYYMKYPKAVVLPISVKDVQKTVKFAKKYKTGISVKGRGHSGAGLKSSTLTCSQQKGYCLNDDIVLDMRYFNTSKMVGPNTALIGAGLFFFFLKYKLIENFRTKVWRCIHHFTP